MPGPLTAFQFERISTWYLRGYSVPEIMAEFNIEQNLIEGVLEQLKQKWHEEATESPRKRREKELAKINMLEKEAWKGWDRSRETVETSDTDKGMPIEYADSVHKVKKTSKAGEIVYLKMIQWCISQRLADIDRSSIENPEPVEKPPIDPEELDFGRLSLPELEQYLALKVKMKKDPTEMEKRFVSLSHANDKVKYAELSNEPTGDILRRARNESKLSS